MSGNDDLIPSQRIPEKRASALPPLVPPPVSQNGRGTLPKDVQHQVDTWSRHAGKILGATGLGTLSVNARGHFIVVTRDSAMAAELRVAMDNCLATLRKQQRKGG